MSSGSTVIGVIVLDALNPRDVPDRRKFETAGLI